MNKMLKRFSLLIAFVMILASVSGIYVSAAGSVTTSITALGLTNNEIIYTGVQSDDAFIVAVNLTVDKDLKYWKATLSWDANKLEYLGASAKIEDLGGVYSGDKVTSDVMSVVNDLNVATGSLIANAISVTPMKNGSANFTTGAVLFVKFVPVSANTSNATITLESARVLINDGTKDVYAGSVGTSSLLIKVNGGAANSDPVTSLGAKINIARKGLRFGALYNKQSDKELKEIGVLMYPTSLLGSDTLNLEYAASHSKVAKVKEIGIEDVIANKKFNTYDSFVFHASIINIPTANLDTLVTAVPYVIFSDGTTIYGEAKSRSYNSVVDGSGLASGEGDNQVDPGDDWWN